MERNGCLRGSIRPPWPAGHGEAAYIRQREAAAGPVQTTVVPTARSSQLGALREADSQMLHPPVGVVHQAGPHRVVAVQS
jgi:hypothetical protein